MKGIRHIRRNTARSARRAREALVWLVLIAAPACAASSGPPEVLLPLRTLVVVCCVIAAVVAACAALAVWRGVRLRREAQRLRESEARWHAALDGSAQGVWDWNIVKHTTYFSPLYKRILGYADHEIGESENEWRSRLHPEDALAIEAALQAYYKGAEEYYVAEFRIQHKEGRYIWLQTRGKLVERTAEGGPKRMIGTVSDISGRRAMEAEIRRLNTQLEEKVVERTAQLDQALIRLKLATEAADVGIWTWTVSTNRLEWDERMCEIYELPEASRHAGLYYDYWRACIHPDDRARAEAALDKALRTDSSFDTVFRIVLPGGRVRYIQPGSVANLAPDGTPLGMVGINRDITAQREQEISLISAKEQAETASIIKSRFLANMSHEIRTPLNAMIGRTDVLLESTLTAQQRDYLEKIQSAGRVLLSVLNDILDHSKIEAGLLALESEPLRIADILERARALFDVQAREKQIALRFAIAPEVPPVLVGDGLRLQQIINNLVGNAVKFTDHGSVEVTVSCTEKTPGAVLLKVAVTDTGIGLSFEQISRLFSAFQQADASITRKYGGSGLGLSISKRLAELMGGEIGVESLHEKGSIFWFTARLGVAPEGHNGSQRPPEADSEPAATALPAADMLALRGDLEELERLLAIGQARAKRKCSDIEVRLAGTREGLAYAKVVRAVARFDFDAALEHLRALMNPAT